jgi:hypothetical protein
VPSRLIYRSKRSQTNRNHISFRTFPISNTAKVLEISSRDILDPLPIGLLSLLKHYLPNENPHSRFHAIYQSTWYYFFPHTFTMSDAVDCGSGGGDDSSFGLRIASVFIILVGSMAGALFPVLAKRSSWLHVPKLVFEFVLKFFIILVFYIHVVTASPNTLVQESLYDRRPFRV